MNQRFRRYFVFLAFALVFVSCRQAKYVPEGRYLHKKNEILIENISAKGDTTYKSRHDLIYVSEMYDFVKPATNKKIKLFFYNRIDSARHMNQLERKQANSNEKNSERIDKEKKINDRRIARARKKGNDTYNHKTKKLKPVKNGWRDWVVTKLGEPPVLYDSALVTRSTRQLDIYMDKRGFFDATVTDTTIFKKKKKKAFVIYTIVPGQPYYIDSFSIAGTGVDANMLNMYRRFLKADKSVLHEDNQVKEDLLVDEDLLDEERYLFSKYCRDEAAFFGFNQEYITFEKDTLNGRGHEVHIIMNVAQKEIEHPGYKDSIVYLPHRTHRVSRVTFNLHNPDTSSFVYGLAAYEKRLKSTNIPLREHPWELLDSNNRYYLLDTLNNIDTVSRPFKGDSIVNKGYFIYNDIPFLDPDLIDKQNFLYIPHYAKEHYLERTYRTMLQLDVFSSISPKIEVDPKDPFGTNVHVTYDLVPADRQTFTVEPRLTNSNSILGLMGSVNYTNKNMFRGAQKLKLSFSGGFESQPLIIAEDGEESRIRQLNTFEWGPTAELSFPRLVPIPKKWLALSSKRAYPETTIGVSVNFQKRPEFDRRLAAFTYEWSFKIPKTMELTTKWINFNFVKLDKTDAFEAQLDTLNDPFLTNSYADHFSLFNEFVFHLNNQPSEDYTGVHTIDYKVSFIQSGAILNGTGIGVTDTNGIKSIFGVPFTQFIRLDNQFVYLLKINKKHKLATRFLGGFGWAYGNSPSLPYEQSFYAGGSNDIRAFPARSMAPGGMPIDTNATTTQIGDMRLETNLEWRFYMTDLFEGAFFVDMGNIWKLKNDPTTTLDNPAIFGLNTFWRQVAIGTGFGVRADFDFLIVRADLAFPIHNPYMPAGERWFGTPHPIYDSYWDKDYDGTLDPFEKAVYDHPFALKLNIGIGYPF